MRYFSKPATALLTAVAFIVVVSFTNNQSISASVKPAPVKIQAAILLDVSNSMDGLNEQAKAQLWNMVTVMGDRKSVV